MKQVFPYIAWAIRISSGMVLIFIGLQSIEAPTVYQGDSLYPILFKSTNVLLLDVLLRVLFVVFGTAIMLGIRTRLLSAFMLSVTLLTAISCINECEHIRIGQYILAYLIAGLATLIVRGGGIYALRPQGWRNIPL